jgi:hypothetical protein
MSDPEGFDVRIAAQFEQQHRQVPGDSFVDSTMRRVRAERRSSEVIHIGLRVAALVLVAVASPWLIAGVVRLNAALEFSIHWAAKMPGAWALGAVAVLLALATRVRSR